MGLRANVLLPSLGIFVVALTIEFVPLQPRATAEMERKMAIDALQPRPAPSH